MSRRVDPEWLRSAVFEEWDPIAVHTPGLDAEDRQAYWDEYDDYLGNIARCLERGDEPELARYLSRVRTRTMGLTPAPELDVAAARNLSRRYSETAYAF